MADQSIPTGQQRPTDQIGDYNRQMFAISQALRRVQTAMPVKVLAVTNAGGVSPVGFVDILPLVNQIDGAGNPVPHTTIHNVPYNRIQGGTNAIIIDPEVGDIGMAAFASRDITKVKKTRAQANPGSLRSHNWADGMYFGGFLNAAPAQYIQFNAAGITIHGPTAVTITAPVVNVTAGTSASVTAPTIACVATTQASISAPSLQLGDVGGTLRRLVTEAFEALFNAHVHNDSHGGNTSVPTVAMDASHLTDKARAN